MADGGRPGEDRDARNRLAAQRIRLLAVDIDGTLVNSRDEITPAVRAALQAAGRAGITIVLATGRRYSRTLPVAESLALSTPLITASGALIKSPLTHRTLHCARFDEPLLAGVLAAMREQGHEAVAYADSYHEGFDFYCPRLDTPHPELADYLEKNPGCAREVPAMMSEPPPGIFGAFATGSRAAMLAMGEELHRRFPGRLYIHISRSYRYIGDMCEVSPAGHTKWSGVRLVARNTGIADDEICAIGDDHNDLPMLHGAGVGIAMGNALDEVKAAADWTTLGHDEDGLANVVRWLIESR